ncbi:MAG: N-acetylmuramic acid 6-phosphate etherase [Candidatus Omnitrophica bacterium]|nr:N-acetylmuramic acid 6-phosphate etherase [Candidatus Omnitrophota bacterium]
MSTANGYDCLPTEQPHPKSRHLDRLSTTNLPRLMNREDAGVPRAVARVIPQVARAVSLIERSLRRGGRLFFLGAGTSGRLGVIEAAECPPTFSTPPRMIQALIAGDRPAVFRSQEGAEDDRARARRDVNRRIRAGDVVVGIAASGVTPFVEAGLRAARTRGASTVLVTCHPQTMLRPTVDVLIGPTIGPELLTGSTRLKAGTATKLILNMLTLATMVRLGKVYGNRMVDVRPTSRKLRARAVRIIQELVGASPQEAARWLRRSRGEVKTAVVMASRKIDARPARRLLARHDGKLRQILR